MQIIHTKYYKLRKKILAISLMIIFLLFIFLKFLLPDYLVKDDELKIDTGIIKYASIDKYAIHTKYGISYRNCLDVFLRDKLYYIRFNDELDKKYWTAIKDSNNFSKTIQVKFQLRLLQRNILYNPNEVSIDNKVIIPSDSKKSFIGWALIFFIIVIVSGLYFVLKLWKQYKEKLYWEDKQIGKESKVKLISVWLNE